MVWQKRLLFILPVIVLFAIPTCLSKIAFAELSWQPANQATVSWDAVTKTEDGEGIPPGDIVRYTLHIVRDGDDFTNAVEVGETDRLEYVITFEEEGRWLVGVNSYRIPSDTSADPNEDNLKSTITWSNSIDIIAVPVPFGVVYFALPASVAGFGLE